MKKYFPLLIGLIFSCNSQPKKAGGIIELTHIGSTIFHPYNPIYISTKKIKIHLDENNRAELYRFFGNRVKITPQNEEGFVEAYYRLIITDSCTFYHLQKFINTNQKEYCYTDAEKAVPTGTYSYCITINGVKSFLNYKLRRNYLKLLEKYLNYNHCDKNVIKELSYLR